MDNVVTSMLSAGWRDTLHGYKDAVKNDLLLASNVAAALALLIVCVVWGLQLATFRKRVLDGRR
ncbi:MAG: hypothetical protein ACK40A_19405, partial [Pannonibacter indicus]